MAWEGSAGAAHDKSAANIRLIAPEVLMECRSNTGCQPLPCPAFHCDGNHRHGWHDGVCVVGQEPSQYRRE
jgi:hypothetical protein